MSDNPKKPDEKKQSNAEKPVSLAGATFKEVLAALLKTPKPEKREHDNDGKSE